MALSRDWLKTEYTLVAWLLAAVPFVEISAAGSDGPLLGAIAAFINCLTGFAIMALIRPSRAFILQISGPLLLLLAGLLWAVWPDLLAAFPASGMPMANAGRIAPDLVATDAARALGQICLLAGAAVAGSRLGVVRITMQKLCAVAALNLTLGLILRQISANTVWGMEKGILADRFTGTMLNANAMGTAYGTFALIVLGCILALMRGGLMIDAATGKRWIVLLVAVYCALMAACGLTGSRTAFLATTICSTILILFFARRYRRTAYGWPVIVLGIVGFAVLMMAGGLAAMARLPHLQSDAIRRIEIWQHFLEMARHAGPHGYGLGSFAQINLAALPDSMLATDLWYVNSAHNILLQMVIEGGAAYAVLSALGLGWILAVILRHMPTGETARLLYFSLLMGAFVILLVGLVDIAMNVPGVMALGSVVLGLAWGRALRERHRNQRAPAESGQTRLATSG